MLQLKQLTKCDLERETAASWSNLIQMNLDGGHL